MNIAEETTRFIFHDYTPNERSILRRLISASDKTFLYEDEDWLACPIGVENYIKRKFPDVKIEEHPPWPVAKMKFIPQDVPPPRNRLQKDALKFLREYKDRPQLGLITNTGSGKAQPCSTPIPMYEGKMKFLGDLEVGDVILSRDGKPTKVTGIYEQGKRQVFIVRLADGRETRCASDHLWTIATRNIRQMTVDTLELKAMLDAGVVTYIPTNNPVEFAQRIDPLIDPIAYGMMMATCIKEEDGSLRVSGRNVNLDFVRTITSICPIYFEGRDHSYQITNCWEEPLKSGCRYDMISESICSMHDDYRYGSEYTRSAVLNGIFAAIGEVIEINGCYYNTFLPEPLCNTHIVDTILYLARSLGYTAGFDGERVIIKTPTEDDNDYLGSMVRVTEVRETILAAKMRCITVDNSEHLYLTEDFIVTHNTYMSIAHAIRCAEKTLIICPTSSILEQWVSTLTDMFKIPENRILHVNSTAKLQQMQNDFDWVLVLEQTLQTLVRSRQLEDVLKKCKFGLKIIDEIHMFLRNNIAIDCCSNISKSLYLTGTFFRTGEEESNLFEAVYHGILRFECISQEDIERYGQPKHIELYSVIIDSKLTKREVRHIIVRAKLSKNKSANVVSVGRYMNIVCPTNGKVTEYMKQSLAVIKRMRERVPYGRMLILVPSINATQKFRKLIADMFPKLKVGCINSEQSRSLNTRVKQEADIVVSTSKSSGVGFDMKDLSVLVAVEQFRSAVLVEQISGRLRPRTDKKPTYYVDIADKALGSHLLEWRNERLTRLKKKAKSYTQFRV